MILIKQHKVKVALLNILVPFHLFTSAMGYDSPKQSNSPLNLYRILIVLHENKVDSKLLSDLIKEVKRTGVDFQMNAQCDEQMLRKEGASDELIDAIRNHYRPQPRKRSPTTQPEQPNNPDNMCEKVKEIQILIIAEKGTSEFEKLKQVGSTIAKLLLDKHCHVKGPYPHSDPITAAEEVKHISVIKYFDVNDKASAEGIAGYLKKTGVIVDLEVQDHSDISDAKSLKQSLEIYLLNKQ